MVGGFIYEVGEGWVAGVDGGEEFMVSLEYVGSCCIMDQEAEKGVSLDFRFQIGLRGRCGVLGSGA